MAGDHFVAANVARFSGFAELYDRYRPQPPAAIVDLLIQLAGSPHPAVVDLGSGTGLSTLIWAQRAKQAIGVEPGADMRRQAERRAVESGAGNVRFKEGLSTATGLPQAHTDIVTCSQALHWMEPQGTFAEVARILRVGGVFAAYDCDWPPTFNWEAERAFAGCLATARKIEQQRRLAPEVRRWSKTHHLERMNQSGRFRYVRETLLHHVETGGADRLIGLMRSQGTIETLLGHGLGEAEIGLAQLRETARRALGEAIVPWYWSYRVRIGIK